MLNNKHSVQQLQRAPDGSTQNEMEPITLGLIQQLCSALAEKHINYCHWKSNDAIHRSASGDNDLDLLIGREELTRFTQILGHLGFKPAIAPLQKQMPGVLDYFGFDAPSGKLVHVHAHYQLVLGHDMTKNYRLPIERPFLNSATLDEMFQIPAPEFEYIVFVLRMVLKHAAWEAILGGEGKLSQAEKRELTHLEMQIDPERVKALLKEHLPYIDLNLFAACTQALLPKCSLASRIKTALWLQRSLQANGRRPNSTDSFLKLWRRGLTLIKRRLKTAPSKYQLGSGGVSIAIVGGDGAGKTTAVSALHQWLAKYFITTRVHMGKPHWSLPTIAIRTVLKVGNLLRLYPAETTYRQTLSQTSLVSPGYPWLLRELCRAKDRYRTYLSARRFANKGGLVLFDRYPIPQIQLMDGPLTQQFLNDLANTPQPMQLLSPHDSSAVVKSLIELETSYYRHIVPPELLIVLRVDPEIAVLRKTEEDAAAVRERSAEIWYLDWHNTRAQIVDAGQDQTTVLRELKSLIWASL